MKDCMSIEDSKFVLVRKKRENGDGTDLEMSASLLLDLKVGIAQPDLTW